MRERRVLCWAAGAFHRVAYVEWGDQAAERTAICVHGLTGTGRDFDELACALVREGFRVVCPDLAGRGASDRLSDPALYAVRQYVADMATLLACLESDEVHWIGTSLGGLVGMFAAAAERSPVRSLVLNDIGPFLPGAALGRIGTALGADPWFPDLTAAEAYMRVARAACGALPDEHWRLVTERTVRPDGQRGGWRLHYDPAIAVAFGETSLADVELWGTWDRIRCPVLVLRGASSDLLLDETAREMTARGPGAELIELAGCGHSPALMDPGQIELVVEWLRSGRAQYSSSRGSGTRDKTPR